MNLFEFLDLKNTDLSSVIASVKSVVGLRADDILLAAGSLVENLGNSKSDVDLLLITSRDSGSLPAQDEIGLVVGRSLVDLSILHAAQVHELVGRLRDGRQTSWDITYAVQFSLVERKLLHRLLHGLLLNEAKDEQVARLRPLQTDLARLKLQDARQTARTIQVDMVGYRESADYASLMFSSQELLGHAVDALTAGHQLTNPVAKWRHRLLSQLCPDWEHPLLVRPSGCTAAQLFWHLHRAPEHPDRDPALEHAFRITTFARAVFLWAERRLVSESHESHAPTAWPSTDDALSEPPLPNLDFDVDFALTGDKATVARLNEFGETVEMSQRELSAAMLFDGITTAREAEAVLYRGNPTASTRTSELLARLDRARLIASSSNLP